MKHLIYVLFVLFAFAKTNAQDLTLLHINAKWNESNNYNLRGIKGAKIQMAYLEDQSSSIKSQIKSVPTIILLDKNGKPRGQWKAGLSFVITATQEEIQNRINVIMLENTRRRSTN
tara:strand:- start:2215 stop:2562 length:348 start_codon:yes stop_codon:yes gene_type:complete